MELTPAELRYLGPARWRRSQRGVNVDLGAFALRDAKSFPNMSASNDTMREIAKALRRHVDTATLEKVVNELLEVPGNRDFRNAIEELARELMRR